MEEEEYLDEDKRLPEGEASVSYPCLSNDELANERSRSVEYPPGTGCV